LTHVVVQREGQPVAVAETQFDSPGESPMPAGALIDRPSLHPTIGIGDVVSDPFGCARLRGGRAPDRRKPAAHLTPGYRTVVRLRRWAGVLG